MKALDRARLGAAARRRLRDAVVLATFLPPLRRIVVWLYDVALAHLCRSLRVLPYVREIGLTGSMEATDGVFGASDIDLIVIAEGRVEPNAKREVRSIFARARRVFPFVGEVDERTGNLLFGADVGTNPMAAVCACRRKAGSYRPLWVAPPTASAGTGDEDDRDAGRFTPVEVVAEITLQLQSIATQTLARSLHLYFWKTKIRVLENLLRRSNEAGAEPMPCFDGAHVELLRRLRETPNRRLYFQRRGDLDAVAWEIVLRLVGALTAAHGLERLAAATVAFHATPARQSTADPATLPPALRAHEFFTRSPEAFGGDSVLNAPVMPYLLLEAIGAQWVTFRAALDSTRQQAEDGFVLLWLGDWVFQLHRDRCRGVFSRYDRPWLFPNRFPEPGKLVFPDSFLDRLLAERDLDLDYLRNAFYGPVLDREAPVDPARHGDSLRYFEDRERTLNGFAFIHTARCLSRSAIVSFGDRDQVFAHAVREHEGHGRMLSWLRSYARAVEAGTLAEVGASLPPALMRAARRFFGDLLDGRMSDVGYDLDSRLTLSLCVCTKNRAPFLEALLRSVTAQTRRPDEVLILDNGSTDSTAAVAARFAELLPLRRVIDRADTIAKARNRALREASGEIVCFTDDDCVLHPGWLHFLEESFFLEEEIGIVGGRVLHLEEGPSIVDAFHRAYLGVRL